MKKELKYLFDKYCNKVFESRNYGEYIIESIFEIENIRYCNIKFINTEYKDTIRLNHAKTKNIKDRSILKKCDICGITEDKIRIYSNTKFGKSLCRLHFDHMRRKGKILTRTRYDPNEIVEYPEKGYAEIILYDKYGDRRDERAIVDLCDVAILKQYRWSMGGNGYVNSPKLKIPLHRFIMGLDRFDKTMCDHKNTNPLDCRKSNLRLVNKAQNEMNKGLRSNNTSGVTGVYWDKSMKKWNPKIGFKGKNIHLGYFDDIEDAIKERKEAEIKYFGEYRYQGDTNE